MRKFKLWLIGTSSGMQFLWGKICLKLANSIWNVIQKSATFVNQRMVTYRAQNQLYIINFCGNRLPLFIQ